MMSNQTANFVPKSLKRGHPLESANFPRSHRKDLNRNPADFSIRLHFLEGRTVQEKSTFGKTQRCHPRIELQPTLGYEALLLSLEKSLIKSNAL